VKKYARSNEPFLLLDRKAIFGPFYEDGRLINKSFSFDKFVFPSCEEYNNRYSRLESIAKNLIENLLSENKLSSTDFYVLLSWFDKIRIGLWLASIYMYKNFFGWF